MKPEKKGCDPLALDHPRVTQHRGLRECPLEIQLCFFLLGVRSQEDSSLDLVSGIVCEERFASSRAFK